MFPNPPQGQEPIETLNKFLVGVRGDEIVIMNPPRTLISKEDALLLAAYLVAMADTSEGHEQFERVLEAVEST